MSQIAILYELKANLVGLKPSQSGMPEGTCVFSANQVCKVRTRDPPVKQGITQEQTGETKGALSNKTGPCTIKGNLPEDVAYVKGNAKVFLYIDNS